eukprot:1207100-Rhodomonas_salina.4
MLQVIQGYFVTEMSVIAARDAVEPVEHFSREERFGGLELRGFNLAVPFALIAVPSEGSGAVTIHDGEACQVRCAGHVQSTARVSDQTGLGSQHSACACWEGINHQPTVGMIVAREE